MTVSGQFDEVGRLLLLELARLHEPELHRGGVHALLEISGVEAEAVAEKLDNEIVAGDVVGRFSHVFSGKRPTPDLAFTACTRARGGFPGPPAARSSRSPRRSIST